MYDNEFMDFVEEAFSDVFTEEMKNADDFRKKKHDEKSNSYDHAQKHQERLDAKYRVDQDSIRNAEIKALKHDDKTWNAGTAKSFNHKNGYAADAIDRHNRRHPDVKLELAYLLGSNF